MPNGPNALNEEKKEKRKERILSILTHPALSSQFFFHNCQQLDPVPTTMDMTECCCYAHTNLSKLPIHTKQNRKKSMNIFVQCQRHTIVIMDKCHSTTVETWHGYQK